MALWSKKFTLLDLYRCGLLNDVLPQISSRYKGKVKENKVFTKDDVEEPTGASKTIKNNVPIESIEKQIAHNVKMRLTYQMNPNKHITKVTAIKGQINFYLKALDYNTAVDMYNDIVSEIKAMKSTLAYVNSFQNEIEKALKYSMSKELKGKEIPKIALKINDLSQLRGMTQIQKKHIVENIIESILFDDDFSAVRTYAKTDIGTWKKDSEGHKYNTQMARYEDTLDNEHKYKYWKTLKKDYDLRVERYVYDNGKMKMIKE